jgi:hypothetical protein
MAGVGETIQSRPCTTVWQRKHKRRSPTVWQGATLVKDTSEDNPAAAISKSRQQTADSNFIAVNFSLVCFGVVQSTARRIDCPQVCLHVGFYAPSGIGKIQKYSICTMHKKGDFSSGTCMYAG